MPALVPFEALVVLFDVAGTGTKDCLVILYGWGPVCTGVRTTAHVRHGVAVWKITGIGTSLIRVRVALHSTRIIGWI
jgi:hypothetical protein